MTIHIFYHNADLDGYCSGAIAYRALLGRGECIRLHGINYGDPVPWDLLNRKDEVYMLDFGCQPFDDMLQIKRIVKSFIWIDHHISSINDMEESGETFDGIQCVGKAGCELAWEYFHPDTNMPKAVHWLGRYDVWDHSCKEARPFQLAMHLDGKPKCQDEIWGVLFSSDELAGKILEHGDILNRYQQSLNRSTCGKTHCVVNWKGLRCICANAPIANSFVFDGFYSEKRHDMMVAYSWIGKLGMWGVSLYSTKEDVDCSRIAKSMGGGGHKGAAGFQTEDITQFTQRRPGEI